jgi:hypothetical protein
VLHLQARVHLQEVEAARAIDDELDRAGVGVAGGGGQTDGGGVIPSRSAASPPMIGRTLLDDLLVAALDGHSRS